LFSAEFQSGGLNDFGEGQLSFYDLHTRLSISTGMRAINHYLFHAGENDPILSPVKRHDWGPPIRKDGTVRKHYHRYPKLSRVLAAYGRDLTVAQPETVTTIGFLLDYFMTEVNNEFTQDSARVLTHQREVVLFDMLARSLALSHRPFSALDLDRAELSPARTPVLWAMLEKQCSAGTQHKLVAYLRQGGRLVLAGRMCIEDFGHQPCTELCDALGIKAIESDPPFAHSLISAFGYDDVPVSFVETYAGDFDEVVATRKADEVVGFVKQVGRGQALMFGAALGVWHLDDLDLVHRMALKMDGPPAFRLSDWADVRLSRGENGSFLFLNNYQDDPVETTIEHHGQPLLGGHPVHLPARQGLILPIDWHLQPGVTLHYVTAEVVEVSATVSKLTLKTSQPAFAAELTLSGYRCQEPLSQPVPGQPQRLRVQGTTGVIVLSPAGA
jgi:beta-galactosidase